MVDFARIVGFEWDAGNSRKSAEKPGVSQAEVEQTFLNQPLLVVAELVVADAKHSQAEPRFHALGRADDGRRLHITFTLRHGDTTIRVISARGMQRKEVSRYEQET